MAASTPMDPPTELLADSPTHRPIACTLTPGAYAERVTWIAALNRRALRSHSQSGGVLTLIYVPGVATEVRELVRREAECCAFLHFELDVAADAPRLTVAVPAHARDAADVLLAPFLAGVRALDQAVGRMAATFSRQAVLDWDGDVLRGAGAVRAGTGAFDVPATFPRVAGDPEGATTPEELLAATHAVCFGIALRSVLAQHGGSARHVQVTATVTAEKGGTAGQGIRVRASHLAGLVEGLAGVEPGVLSEIARVAEERCTISAAIRDAVAITVAIRTAEVQRP